MLVLKGVGVSPGIAAGIAYRMETVIPDGSCNRFTSVEGETERFVYAVRQLIEETSEAAEKMNGTGESEAEILVARVSLLSDSVFHREVEAHIKKQATAQAAVERVLSSYITVMQSSQDDAVQKNVAELEEIKTQLQCMLCGAKPALPLSALKGAVIVAESISPLTVAKLPKGAVLALAAEKGGALSHAAILARARGIPAVFSVPKLMTAVQDGNYLTVDGNAGAVYFGDEKAAVKPRPILNGFQPSARSTDGLHLKVYATACSVAEAMQAFASGGEGIGLFRTEFLYDNALLGEEAQYRLYRDVINAASGREVIFRTADFGADKPLPGIIQKHEQNPLLGLRGVRFSLKHRQVLIRQLKALLRAAVCKNLKILLPFVTVPDEVKRVKALLQECAAALQNEGKAYAIPPIGVMIETPAAVLISDLLAKEADFFSLGLNDLTSLLLATDREDDSLYGFGASSALAVRRAIETVAQNAAKADVPVYACGEAAADGKLLPFLVKNSIKAVSVAPTEMQRVRLALMDAEKRITLCTVY